MKAAGKFAVTVIGAALAVAGALPATAAVAQEGQPTYRCQILITEELPRAEGYGCEALNGAPEEGPIFGEFRIEDYRGGLAVQCEEVRPVSGFADTPQRVIGETCHPSR